MNLSKGKCSWRQDESSRAESDGSLGRVHSARPNPRTVTLHKEKGDFGFTLRHFIVYPPESIRSSQPSSQIRNSRELQWRQEEAEPMDTIFIREVQDGTPAHQAGLMTGDRIITINNQPLTGKSYKEIITLIQKSGSFLQLLVVPKEDDILQLYFASSAYQPVDRESKPQSRVNIKPSYWDSARNSISSENTSYLQPLHEYPHSENIYVNIRNKEVDKHWRSPSRKPGLTSIGNSDTTSFFRPKDCCDPWCLQDNNDRNRIAVSSIPSDFGCSTNNRPLYSSGFDHRLQDKFYIPQYNTHRNHHSSIQRPLSTSGYLESEIPGTTYHSYTRPQRFQDALSKLLYDMWYQQDSQHSQHTHSPQRTQMSSSIDSQRLYSKDMPKDRRDQSSGGVATLISRTMKALVAHPTDLRLLSSEAQPSYTDRSSHDPRLNVMSRSVDSAHKYHSISGVDSSIYSQLEHGDSGHSHYRTNSLDLQINDLQAQQKNQWKKTFTDGVSSEPNSYNSGNKSSHNNNNKDFSKVLNGNVNNFTCDSNQSLPINLVAQRKHQFESGSLLAKSQERTKLYKSELTRMSSQSPTHIVSVRAAQFESLSPPITKASDSKANAFFPSDFNMSSKYITAHQRSFSKPETCSEMLSPVENFKNYTHQSSSAPVVKTAFSSNEGYIKDYLNRPASSPGSIAPTSYFPVVSDRSSEQVQSNAEVVYRRKALSNAEQDDHHVARRISYLRATAEDRIHVDSDLSDDDEQPCTSSPSSDHKIQKLKSFFGEKTPKIKQAIEPLLTPEENTEPLKSLMQPFQGWLLCKIVLVEGKRASDRSWRHVWAFCNEDILYLLKERKAIPALDGPVNADDHIIEMKSAAVSIAHDYTKRKHVLRLKLTNGTEYLFQAENHSNMVHWLQALQNYSIEDRENWISHMSVLEKAAAYEQQLQTNKGRLSPLSHQRIGKKLAFRHRSPSGNSPATKSRRASHGDELALPKLWRDRMVQGWRKVHGSSAPLPPPKGATIGIRLDECPPATNNEYVPLLLELCTQIVETKGLEVVGIYRVPGNNAAVSMLMDSVNQGFDSLDLQDHRWNDVNVVSSLLKAFFRKLPEPLLTSHLYPKFIEASKLENTTTRLIAFKKLAHLLPVHHLETLKFLMRHLQKVVNHANINKMEARNLAIVFGPTLVRAADSSMIAMVTDMSHQCYIIETMITYADWLFGETGDKLPSNLETHDKRSNHPAPVSHPNMLIDNIHKLDGPHSGVQDMLPRELLTSFMSAANRRMWHRQRKAHDVDTMCKRMGMIQDQKIDELQDEEKYRERKFSKDVEATTHTPRTEGNTELSSVSSYSSCASLMSASSASHSKQRQYSSGNPKDSSFPYVKHRTRECSSYPSQYSNLSPGSLGDEVVVHTYGEVSAITQERIRNFERETKALLQRDSQRIQHRTSRGRVEWEQIEKEWQKAKLELEQEDLLDHLADDPSFLSYLLNRGENQYSSLPNECYSTGRTSSHEELENISRSLDKKLQLEQSAKRDNLEYLYKGSRPQRHSTNDGSLCDNTHENQTYDKYEQRTIPALNSGGKHNHWSYTRDSSLPVKPRSSTLSTSKLLSQENKGDVNNRQPSFTESSVVSSAGSGGNNKHHWCPHVQRSENYLITATVSPSKHTVSTKTSSSLITETILPCSKGSNSGERHNFYPHSTVLNSHNHQNPANNWKSDPMSQSAPSQRQDDDWGSDHSSGSPPAVSSFQRRHTIASTRAVGNIQPLPPEGEKSSNCRPLDKPFSHHC